MSSARGCTGCPLVYQMWNSLANEARPVQTRHPGDSFPVYQMVGSCPQVNQWLSLLLLTLVHPLHGLYKGRATTFWHAPGVLYSNNPFRTDWR